MAVRQPKKIHGSANVATWLGVSRQSMSNYLASGTDTPKPQYVTDDGRMFWDDKGLRAWTAWKNER